MKGNDVYKRVLNLLGYINSDDSITSDVVLYKRSLHIFNQILLDLNQKELNDFESEMNLSKPYLEALIYGVAMLLSLNCGDAERNKIYTNIYNAKRSAALSSIETITDVMPTTVEGES